MNKRNTAMLKSVGALLLLIALSACRGPGGARPERGGRPEDGAGFVARLDKDGDGKVSRDEFDGPSKHFARLDKNNDGFISENEVPTNPPPRGRR